MKMAESSKTGRKTLLEKEKLPMKNNENKTIQITGLTITTFPTHSPKERPKV